MQLVTQGKISATAFGFTLVNFKLNNLMFHSCNRQKELSAQHVGMLCRLLVWKKQIQKDFLSPR